MVSWSPFWNVSCLVLVLNLISSAHAAPNSGLDMSAEQALFKQHAPVIEQIRGAMLSSIRTSWEQGTAAHAQLETDNPEYSVFGSNPFANHAGDFPNTTLRFALSAVVRQAPDGRLSQEINDAQDGAALDGASAGTAVLVGTYTEPSRQAFWQKGAAAQLNYVLNVAPRTSTGAISHRADSKQYWADGVFMGPPFIAFYGGATKNQTLLQIAYDQVRLYRNALLVNGPTGKLWAHIFSDDTKTFNDAGIWGTGNAWAALGALRVQQAIAKSPFASSMTSQSSDLLTWVKEILDGYFRAINSNNLLPDYVSGGATFGDASCSAALASVAYRAATINPQMFGSNYTTIAAKLRDSIFAGVDDLGVMSPLVDPLNWGSVGILSTEGQAFGLMMMAAWKSWAGL